MASCSERNLIGRRTQSDRTADAIRLDGVRNLIGRRTETGGDVPPTDAPTKQTERVSHRIRGTHRTFWQRKPPTDAHRLGGYGILPYPRRQQRSLTSVEIREIRGIILPRWCSCLCSALPLARARTAPTKQMGRVPHRTRGTHRTFWQRSASHRLHGCAQIRRVWHPAIPTLPITQPNHLWKSVKSVGEYYHAGATVSARLCRLPEQELHQQSKWGECPTEHAEHIEPSGEESLPQIGTDVHRLGGKNAT